MIFHHLKYRILSIIHAQTYEFHKQKFNNMYKLNNTIKIIGMKLSLIKKNCKNPFKN